jgi:hypothetical protein
MSYLLNQYLAQAQTLTYLGYTPMIIKARGRRYSHLQNVYVNIATVTTIFFAQCFYGNNDTNQCTYPLSRQGK